MRKLLAANFMRLSKSRAFFLFLAGMLLLASALMAMQATAMDYTVPLSRVVFLPLSFYGVAAAAFVSVFVGADFSDGFIRNKLLAASSRSDFVVSQLITSSTACILCYAATSFFALGAGQFFFENDVKAEKLLPYFLLGLGMSVSVGCIFTLITLLCRDRTSAVIWCMGLAFGMLFLCLHTNSLLVQTEYKNGVLNPHYVGGFRRMLYGVLHDLNPCGQAAQLSSWEVWTPTRAAVCDAAWVIGAFVLGCMLFRRKDIK